MKYCNVSIQVEFFAESFCAYITNYLTIFTEPVLCVFYTFSPFYIVYILSKEEHI